MSDATRPMRTATVTRDLRRARLGVSLIFATNGILLGSLAPRLPELRDGLSLSYGQLGVAMAMWPVGALLLGLASGTLIRRFRSSRVAVAGMVLCAIALMGAGLASNVYLFAAALFVVGATDAWVDVAQNSHGLRVQRLYRRSINNGFHAMWSLGAVTGGLLGAAAAGLDVSVRWQFAGMVVLVVAINVVTYPLLLKGPEPQTTADEGADEAAMPHEAPRRAGSPRLWLLLGALSLISIAGAWAEDAAATWAASYLRDELAAPAAIAAFGFVSLQGCQFVGRLTGDRMIDRFGQRAVARTGGLLMFVGMGLALAFPSVWGTIVGFGAAGLGIATLIPGAFHAADELPGLKSGSGLTIVGWTLRLAFLLSPPIVGAIADATSLRVGLAIMPVMGLLVVLLAGVMEPRRLQASPSASNGPL
ncbi:MFS transporter [Demequina sp. NBRC 110053]|uniref:MFS transporter n=1 Tax=Demequina sp. NBRC 110053 TaxID=1570342 RepID=UPI001F360DF9|nr:MFS transporter [Demequina sp. NBRC 110053]